MPLISTQFSSKIPRNCRGKTLIQYLSERFTYQSVETWRAKIENGEILFQGKLTQSDQLILGNEDLLYLINNYDEPEVPLSFELIFENEDYLIIGKSAGQPITRTGRIIYNSLVQILRRHFANEDISPLFRLDRETSGLMVFGKNSSACQVVDGNKHGILGRKIYLAVVWGEFLQEKECQAPLKECGVLPIPAKMIIDPSGKEAKSYFRPLLSSSNYSLVMCEIWTGRKHQIRAHLAHLGFPIVGDKIYGSNGAVYVKMAEGQSIDEDVKGLGAESQLLHAWQAEVDVGYGMNWFESKNWSAEFQDYLDLWPEHKNTLRAYCEYF